MTGKILIRFAKGTDEGAILAFLRSHWGEHHIFVTHPEVMRWQHQSTLANDRALNFVLAERVTNGTATDLVGLLGFIPFGHFDPAADCSETALAIWKVREDVDAPGLGLQLLKMLQCTRRPAMTCAIGISSTAKSIYKALGYTVGALSQAVLFPSRRPPTTHLAQNVPRSAYRPLKRDPAVTLRDFLDASSSSELSAKTIDEVATGHLPRKSLEYILNRYLRHPWYRYHLKTWLVDGSIRGIIVIRRVAVPQLAAQALRIVDIIGDTGAFARSGYCLQQLVQQCDCEYIDLMHHGLDEHALANGGFVLTATYPSMVIPNYFEPFEPRNVELEFAYHVGPGFSKYNVCLFRADSDQDRPNLLSTSRIN